MSFLIGTYVHLRDQSDSRNWEVVRILGDNQYEVFDMDALVKRVVSASDMHNATRPNLLNDADTMLQIIKYKHVDFSW